MVPDLELPTIGSAPKTITCLSMSLTMVCQPLVGARLDPDKDVISTALVVTPLDVSQ